MNNVIKVFLLCSAICFGLTWVHYGFYLYGFMLIAITFIFIWIKEEYDEIN